MLLILGVISFLQMTLIPGYLALAYFRLKPDSSIQSWLYTFSLSLLINYLLVYLFTTVGIYKPAVIYAVLVLETILLIYHWTKNNKTRLYLDLKTPVEKATQFLKSNSILDNMLLFISLVFIGLYLHFFISQLDAAFRFIDPVLGWNRFALDWFHNQLPTNSWLYPQLIPSNWSMSYMIMQNSDIQCAARSIMPLFSIGILMIFLDLGLQKRDSIYLLGQVFFGVIIMYLYSPARITSGYVDIAVTFFCFLAFSVLHLHYSGDKQSQLQIKHVILSIIFASAAAVTKQSGLYILVIVLAWNIRLIFKKRAAPAAQNAALSTEKSKDRKTLIKIIAVLLVITILIGLSWYIHRSVLIIKGVEKTGIKAVTQMVHKNRDYGERFLHGFNKILRGQDKKKSNSETFIYLALAFLLFGLFQRRARVVAASIVVPFTVLWGLFYSYDYRNLTMALPFMAFCMAVGVHWFFKKVLTKMRNTRARQVSLWYLLIGFAAVLALLNFTLFKGDSIERDQLNKQKKVGDRLLNQKLYEFHRKNGFEGKIFSKYNYLRFLPVLRDYWTPNREDEQVHYYLETFNPGRKKLNAEIRKKLRRGKYKLLFSHGKYRFIQVKSGSKEKQ